MELQYQYRALHSAAPLTCDKSIYDDNLTNLRRITNKSF